MAAPNEHESPARIVAELGRPETPDETAARKREASLKRRSNQSLMNLVLSLIASLAVVFVIVLIVVRASPPPTPPVDYKQAAALAQPAVDSTLASPVLPSGWSANAAQLDSATADHVVAWYIGFITPDEQFIGLRQGVKANATWIANQVQDARASGTESIAGITWSVYDQRTAKDPGNLAYALSTTTGTDSYVLFGTAKTAEFTVLARSIAEQLTTTKGTTK